MKKLVLLFCCILLTACGARRVEDPFAGEFACTVDCALQGVEYTFSYAKEADGEQIAFLAPASLCGLTAMRRDGTVTLAVGGLAFSALAGDRLFAFAECFTPRRYTTVPEGDGYRLTADGYTVYTDQGGVPLRLVGGRYDLQFSTFEGR